MASPSPLSPSTVPVLLVYRDAALRTSVGGEDEKRENVLKRKGKGRKGKKQAMFPYI